LNTALPNQRDSPKPAVPQDCIVGFGPDIHLLKSILLFNWMTRHSVWDRHERYVGEALADPQAKRVSVVIVWAKL
jgi:hypothetical protein